MEVNVEGVYFGDSSVYHCTTATFSKHSIKMTLSNDGQTENVLILKKNIIDLKASEPVPFPVICLKLKDQACQKIAEVLGVNLNSLSKDKTEVWILIYYKFISLEVPKFLTANYIDRKNVLSCEKMVKFIELPHIKMKLNTVVLSLLWRREKLGEPKPEICLQTNALMVPQEVCLSAKKFVNYMSDVVEGCAVKGRDIEVEIHPEVFPDSEVKQMTESYKSCLVCATCQEKTIQKCKGCKVTRYCSRRCQEQNFSKHKEECNMLLVERKKKEVQERLEMEHLVQASQVTCEIENGFWENRIPFKMWEKKFTCMMREEIREGIREKEKEAE